MASRAFRNLVESALRAEAQWRGAYVAAILVPCPSVFSGLGPRLVPSGKIGVVCGSIINTLLMLFIRRRLYPKANCSRIFSEAQSGRRVQACGDFFIWIRHNPLKSPNSTKGNPRNFPWFSLHFLARNSPDSCICDASSSVSSGLRIGSPLSAGSVDNALGARRRDPERWPEAEIKRRPNKKPRSFRSGAVGFN